MTARPPEPSIKDLASAVHQAKEALKLTPRDAKAYSFAGLMHDRFGQPREAIDYLRTAVMLAPHRAAHYDELGMVYAHAEKSVTAHISNSNPQPKGQPLERWPGGENTCWRAEKPNCFPLKHYTDTQLHIAEEDFLRRTNADDHDWHGFGLLAQLYRNYSVTACTRALKIQPDRPGPFLTLARTLHRGGAIGLYKRALELQPSKPALYREYGALLADLRYYQQANNAYRSSIELEPREPAGYEALAELRLRRNRPDEAFEFANQSLSLLDEAPNPPNAADPGTDKDAYKEAAAAAVPGVAPAARVASWLFGNENDDDESDENLDPKSEKARRRRAKRALKDARFVASRAAQSPHAVPIATAISFMAEARCMQERWLEAASLARSAIHISPENARGYASLAHSLYEQVDKRRKAAQPKYDGTAKSDNPYVPDGELGMMAIEAGEAASTLNPADAPTRYRTGRLLRRVPGRLQEAINHFNGAFRGNETYPDLRNAQAEAVARMTEIKKPKNKTWQWQLVSLASALVLMFGASYLMTQDGFSIGPW